MSTYILQKDLPSVKIGTEFKIKKNNNTLYELTSDNQNREGYYYFNKSIVENNPEWFKLKEDDRDIENACKLIQSKGYYILDPNAFLAYKAAAEGLKKFKYTEEDMRKCWEFAEEGATGHYSTLGSFEDYIKSLDKIIFP